MNNDNQKPFNLKIYVGPCWVDQYKEKFEYLFRDIDGVTVTTGTEHVYVNNVREFDLDIVRMNLSITKEQLDYAIRF